jgi:DNA-directed RNA polymerase specialized sigma24 family protein
MNFVSLYYDITKEIEIYELRLMDLEAELKRARQLCFDGRMPSDPLPVHIPLDKALEQYDSVVAKIRDVSDHLTNKKLIRQRIEANIRDFEGVEHRVAFMRDIEGKPLSRIADELGYSYDWIKKISSRIRKARTRK